MNSIHDMGGMHGFGPIPYEENEPVFHHEWEGRAYALATQTPVRYTKGLRRDIEMMDPAHYLNSTYYEKWLHVRTESLIESGTITRAELETWIEEILADPESQPSPTTNPELLQKVLTNLHKPVSERRETGQAPLFEIGDRVRTRNIHPVGHTRLPRYARDKQGEIVNYYGVQASRDILPSGEPAQPQPLYAVRFDGQELWGESAEPNSVLYLDMWEMYLERSQA